MVEPSYRTLGLSKHLGERWSNIEATRELSTLKIAELKQLLLDLDSEDTSIVVQGSLGRGEFTNDSDIDWFLLVDGIADPHHHDVFLEADKRIIANMQKDVGREKIFATLVSSHDLIHIIGGENDTNNNLTRRLLLLLESTPLTGSITHERVAKNILKRYLLEDRSFWRVDGPHIPHFLLNDFARPWRTMAVDFAYKLRARSGEKWAIRNVKLRMSRKLLYVAGLLACFHPHLLEFLDNPEERRIYEEESFQPEIIDIVHSIFSDNPLDIVAGFLDTPGFHHTALPLFRAYDEFLGVLLDTDQRRRLEELSEAEADSDPIYQKARETSHRFRDSLFEFVFRREAALTDSSLRGVLMQPLGFSTGALALSDFRKALRILRDQPVSVIELSAIRENELIPLLSSLDDLDLSQFEYVSIHAPSSFSPEHEAWIFGELYKRRDRGWPIVVHPDTLFDFSLWRLLGGLLCIENMDKRKPSGRTVRELEYLFSELPQALFCLDIGHARQVDTSMIQAYKMLKRYSSRLRQVHISEVNTQNKHERLSFVSILGFQEVTRLIPPTTPVIIESIVTEDQIGAEICRVQKALYVQETRPPAKVPA